VSLHRSSAATGSFALTVGTSEHFPLLYDFLEAAQCAADDVLTNYRSHDCRQQGCGEWVPIGGPAANMPERRM
jgi:hypothetical protein